MAANASDLPTSVAVGAYKLAPGRAGAQIESTQQIAELRPLQHALEEAGKEPESEPADIAKLERGLERAWWATNKVEPNADLLAAVLRGDIFGILSNEDVEALLGRVLPFIQEKRFKDVVRVVRAVASTLALLKRWVELVESLQAALTVAKHSKDAAGHAWAAHELGTLHLAAGNYAEADRLLSIGAKLRTRPGQAGELGVTEHNLHVLCRTLRERLHEPTGTSLWRALTRRPLPALAVATALLVVGAGVGAAISSALSPSHRKERALAVRITLIPASPLVGEPIAFHASITGKADPARYIWRFGDGAMASGADPTYTYDHPGMFDVIVHVTAANGALNGVATQRVQVRAISPSEPPPPEARFTFTPSAPSVGQPVSFDASSSSDSDPTIAIASYTWRFGDGQTATGATPSHRYSRPGTYAVELIVVDTREAGASAVRKVTIASTRPSPPNAVVATAGDHSATIKWAAPQNGGSRITSYIITPYTGTEAKSATEAPGSETSATINKLTDGTSYTFTVTAANKLGTGLASRHSNSVTPIEGTNELGAPTNVTATAGEGSATVSWTAPTNEGDSPITSYIITPYVGNEVQSTTEAPSSATSFPVDQLTNGTTYTFTVTAINKAGAGPRSQQSNAATPATHPSAPTGVTATKGNASATVSWMAPTDDGGSAITSYIITPYVGNEVQRTTEAPSSATSFPVSQLTNGTIYTFTVTSVNKVGTGPRSQPSNDVTPATSPSAPVGLEAQSEGTTAHVKWDAPTNDGGSEVSGYTVRAYLGEREVEMVSSRGTRAEVTELDHGKTYAFTVTASNAVGPGPPSARAETTIQGLFP